MPYRFSRFVLYAAVLPALASAEVTYSGDVAAIFQAKCQGCHRPNDIAPFALQTFEDAETWAADIREAVAASRMPPWKPVAGHGDFRDSFALTGEERQKILDWVDEGAKPGDLNAQPPPPPAPEGEWAMGEPGAVLRMPEYTPPRAKDVYRCFSLPAGSEENRFVSGYQVLPGDRRQVHHVLLFLDESGESERLEGKDGQPGYDCFGGPGIRLSIGGLLGGWAPGSRPQLLPDGIGVLVPGKTRVVMQVHYHPNGRTAPDQTRVGLYYREAGTVQKRLLQLPLVNDRFEIPAGARDYEVRASLPVFPFLGGQGITVAPHMHLLGQTIRMEVEYRDGTRRPLIYIDKWDFKWQGFYTFAEPVPLPSGATLRLTATYDNSEHNPNNPNNPLKPVRWGEGTEDEMCLGFIGMIFDNENLLPLGAGTR